MAIPPMDEERTLIFGRADISSVWKSDETSALTLERVAQILNLRPHKAQANIEGLGVEQTINVPLSIDVQVKKGGSGIDRKMKEGEEVGFYGGVCIVVLQSKFSLDDIN